MPGSIGAAYLSSFFDLKGEDFVPTHHDDMLLCVYTILLVKDYNYSM